VLVFDERQLRGVLALYAAHYQGWRPHRALLLCPQQRDLLPFGERQIPTGQRSELDQRHPATLTEPTRPNRS